MSMKRHVILTGKMTDGHGKWYRRESELFSYTDILAKLCYFCRNFSSEICYLPQNPGRRYKFCKMTKKLMFVLKCGRNCGRIIETSVFTERQ